MKTVEELQTEINKILFKEIDNLELKRLLNKNFIEKTLNSSTVSLLFNEEKFVEELNEIELICLADGLYKYFSNNEKLNPKKYFSDISLEAYRNYMNVIEDISFIKLHNAIQVNDEEYIAVISYEDIYKYMSASRLSYNLQSQREATYKKIGNKYIAVPTINNKSVKEMSEAILCKGIESTQVVLSYIVGEGIPKIKFEPLYENIGDLIIEEILCIIDGYHRLSAICSSVAKHLAKTKQYLQGYLTVKILISDMARARKVVAESFKRATTSDSWLKAITENDITKFLDKVINQSKILNDNIANTYEEYKAFNKLTYKTIMIDVLNKVDIEYNNSAVVLIKSKKYAEIIDILYEMLKDFDLLASEIAIFIFIAYKIDKSGAEGIEPYYTIAEAIEDITDEQKKDWGLNTKNVKINAIINYINNAL